MREQQVLVDYRVDSFQTNLVEALNKGWVVDHIQTAFDGTALSCIAILSRGKKLSDERLIEFEQRLETWMINSEAHFIKDDTDTARSVRFNTLRDVWELWCSL